MTMTLPTNSNNEHADSEVKATIRRMKVQNRARRARMIRSLAERVEVAPDGTRTFIRFSRNQRIEHQVLIGSMAALALTGLLQTFSNLVVVGWIIKIFGSIETLRVIHHLAAVALGLLSFYHLEQILVTWIVKRERGGMWPSWQDMLNLIQMIKYNLNLVKERPEFDRFTIEEKLEYWAMLYGTPLMGVTGFMLWVPSIATTILPGEAIPVARALHAWEAILATLAIITWHGYNVLIKEKNKSIFTGTMTEEEMLHSHPLEHRRIMAAYEMVSRAKQIKNGEQPQVAAQPAVIAHDPQNEKHAHSRVYQEGQQAD